jgi:L-seryl-tRNA(Ser) seleniumtransferase
VYVTELLARLERPSLRRVINATGVVLHTNLGRAPMPDYLNLEYDLVTGHRGKRDVHVASLIERIAGAPGIVVNNNAAAVFLVLNELAAGHEAIVSRGELIEIGDGFRIPDIMQRSGAVVCEVGSTNRTSIRDYAAAITDRTRLLLRVHPSNFRMTGFTARPELGELVALGRERGIPVYEDLGSGCIVDLKRFGVDEPVVETSIRAGANLVSFSGDKLLGGPQAGIIAGDAELVDRVRRNPLFRALRVDKLVYAALENTLRNVVLERWDRIPAFRMIAQSADEIRARAERLVGEIAGAEIIPGHSVIGGGSTPDQSLSTWLIALPCANVNEAERRCRAQDPPVIGRIENDRLVFDLRTVLPEDEAEFVAAVQALAS